MMTAPKETLGFQAEVRQLLRLMIHSLYSNREIFVRELISNASDACDKLRFESIDRPELLEGQAELSVRISIDKDARTITFSDNGIGMSRQEVIDNLGTIARSGTREFLSRMNSQRPASPAQGAAESAPRGGSDAVGGTDAQLIGQFGVGFYSAFLVADRVIVETRRAGSTEAVRWSSSLGQADADAQYEIEPCDRTQRGTDVVLHLRPTAAGDSDGVDEFLDDWRLKNIVKKYSDHISLPIMLGEERVNSAGALWARPKSELDDAQYREFFRNLTFDATDPLAYAHHKVEGRTEYTQLLYIPAKAPYDLWDRNRRGGVKLYVKRVFIMDDADALMPTYLRFVRGVIDSNDLPLNVSRELLQESRDVRAIREGATKRVLSMLEDMAANDPDKYQSFWAEFGQTLKEGLGEDFANQERLTKLLRFASTAQNDSKPSVSLADYVGRMKPQQEAIFYLTADTYDAARNSPQLEVFRKKEIEVLLLSDRVDEWMLGHLHDYDGKPLRSVARGGVDLSAFDDAQAREQAEQLAESAKPLIEALKTALGDRVKEVRSSQRLTESVSCLVSADHEISGHLERLLKQAGQNAPPRQPILEINPAHPLIKRVQAEQADAGALGQWAELLYEQAVLAEGGQLDNPAGFVKRLNQLLVAAPPPGG